MDGRGMFIGKSNDPGCSESRQLLELVHNLQLPLETPMMLPEKLNGRQVFTLPKSRWASSTPDNWVWPVGPARRQSVRPMRHATRRKAHWSNLHQGLPNLRRPTSYSATIVRADGRGTRASNRWTSASRSRSSAPAPLSR